MLLLSDISKQYAGQTIFNHVTVPLSKSRTALVGMNGSGKSTLMKIVAGLEYADGGDITTKRNTVIEYLPQQAVYDFSGTVYEEVSSWLNSDRFNELSARETEIIQILENNSNPSNAILEELAEVVEELHSLDVKKKRKNSVENILLNLGFTKDDWNRPAKTLSGGWQMRIALARVLVREPDIILLDEPTNYLDIATIDFIADWMLKFDGQVLLVSHDRDFLNRVVEETWEVFSGNVNIYRGNYDFYLVEKEQRIKVLTKQRAKQLDEIKILNEFYEKNRFNAATAQLAQSKHKLMEKLKAVLITLPRTPPKVTFRFPDPKRGGDIVTEINKLYHSFGDLDVIADYKRIVSRGERIALVGRNGFGKSTLMNIIGGEIDPISGECRLGTDIEISYFRQHEITLLPPDMSVIKFIESIASFEMMSKVKTLLGRFLFYEDDWDKKIKVLSGGEKVRLAFIRMIMNPGNLILLDEPTTHLDIDSKEILLKTLQDLDATIIFISHDSHFINSLATNVVYFKGKCDIVNFPGTYQEYVDRYGHDIVEEEKGSSEVAQAPASKGKMDFAEQKKLRNKTNKLKKEVERLQKEINRLEEEKNSGSKRNIDDDLVKLIEKWEEKTEELEKI